MAKVSRFFEQAREFAVLPATIGSPIIGDRRLDSRSWVTARGAFGPSRPLSCRSVQARVSCGLGSSAAVPTTITRCLSPGQELNEMRWRLFESNALALLA